MATIGERIVEKTFEVLDAMPEGVRCSDLVRRVIDLDGSLKQNTVHGNVWNLDERFPDRVYKPSRGLFRLTKYRAPDTDQLKGELVPKQPKKFKEEDFYEPFADWLVNEMEECTKAIALGGTLSILALSSADRRVPSRFREQGTMKNWFYHRQGAIGAIG